MAKLTRRAFGLGALASVAVSTVRAQGNCAPPAGKPVDFVIPNLQNIQRKAVAELNADETTRLRLAYQKLRELTASDPGDPRGWMQQANVHCWNCGQGLNIHGAWTFLPWHRAYLYFHERILCKLLNDDTFRLPYWSWDDSNYRNLPVIYRPAKVDTNAANALYDVNRAPDAVAGKSMPGNIFPANQNPMKAPNFASFGGDGDSGGALENGPHGTIHMWSGTQKGQYVDMGNLAFAARDPLFFAHHCNIDRLWAEFNRLNPVAHANPTDPDFLTHSFQFFDENKQLVTIRVQDVLDTAPLGFSYPPGVKLSSSKMPQWTQLKYNPATHLIQLPDKVKAEVAAEGEVVRERALVLKGVQLPMMSGTYNVFVGNVPPASSDQSEAPNYIGYIGLIMPEHKHNSRCSLVLDPTKVFLQSASGAGARLRFAPAGTTNGANLEFGSAYLTEE